MANHSAPTIVHDVLRVNPHFQAIDSGKGNRLDAIVHWVAVIEGIVAKNGIRRNCPFRASAVEPVVQRDGANAVERGKRRAVAVVRGEVRAACCGNGLQNDVAWLPVAAMQSE